MFIKYAKVESVNFKKQKAYVLEDGIMAQYPIAYVPVIPDIQGKTNLYAVIVGEDQDSAIAILSVSPSYSEGRGKVEHNNRQAVI